MPYKGGPSPILASVLAGLASGLLLGTILFVAGYPNPEALSRYIEAQATPSSEAPEISKIIQILSPAIRLAAPLQTSLNGAILGGLAGLAYKALLSRGTRHTLAALASTSVFAAPLLLSLTVLGFTGQLSMLEPVIGPWKAHAAAPIAYLAILLAISRVKNLSAILEETPDKW